MTAIDKEMETMTIKSDRNEPRNAFRIRPEPGIHGGCLVIVAPMIAALASIAAILVKAVLA